MGGHDHPQDRHIGELKAKPGGSCTASGELVRWLLANQLVDELILLACPVVVGQGRRLFPDTGPTRLELVASRSTPRGGRSDLAAHRPPAVRDAAADQSA